MNHDLPGGQILQGVMLAWLAVEVGPWWIAVIAFLAAWVVNLTVQIARDDDDKTS